MPTLREQPSPRLAPLIFAVAATLFATSFGAAVATRHWLVLPKLQALEARSDRKDLRRVLLAIDAKKLQLSTLAYQNAVNSAMYEHTLRADAAYFDATFPLDMLSFLNIDLVALFDRDRQLVEGRSADDAPGNAAPAPIPVRAIAPYLVDLSKVHDRAPIFDSGFLLTERGPMIYATASVMRSDSTGHSPGNLFYATYVDSEFLHEVEESTRIHIALVPITARDFGAAPAITQVHRDQNNHMSWILTDNAKRPLIKLQLTLPQRDIDNELWSLPLQVSLLASIVGVALMVLIFQRMLVTPLLHIGGFLRRVCSSDDYAQRLDSPLRNELGDLARDIDALVHHVQIQQDQLQAQAREMQALSFLDGLTGLANRRRFDQALSDDWARAQRGHSPLALLMVDVDYFKKYNDHYGHQRGDEALKRIAALLRRVISRQSDLAARYGGEEFAILLPDTNESSAAHIAERLQQELRAAEIPHERSSIGRRMTLSIGIAAMVPDAQHSSRDLVHRADSALYSAKASGRNRIVLISEIGE